ncbi:SnoaL-like domain-containing protein [Novosphingobium sp. CF614]|uniref:nuclear transport factor 2 family protein n=1 Tax=Novosphingobium sp. CF614 TaxID=1884364 RepID=UPI0008EBBBB1|nr:nuclear transport factor 2 family protein [Novosphingobium sp. CF614]SFF77569.1 SnoaL-like domain-containing protein [Novosphingobium sp. CF614]
MSDVDDMSGLAATVRMLADRQAIRDCLMTYCRAVDRLDRELLLSVYHEDAIDDHGVFVGDREAFADWVIAFHARAQHATQHVITNHVCELDGDVAHAETYYMFAAMNRDGAPLTLSGGRYIDRFERRGGRWGIVLRKVVSDWWGKPGEAWLSPEGRLALNAGVHASRDRRDTSYERPLRFDESRRGAIFEI